MFECFSEDLVLDEKGVEPSEVLLGLPQHVLDVGRVSKNELVHRQALLVVCDGEKSGKQKS